MGLGKTVQAIVAADDALLERVLVVCPAIARPNWEAEFRKFSWMDRPFARIVTGKHPIPKQGSVIVSFDGAVRRLEELRQSWDLLVVDEAHFLKSIDAKRTWAVLGKTGLIRHAGKVWGLTGTPMPNHAGELWTWLYTLGQTRLGYWDFLRRYCWFHPGCGPGDPVGGTKVSMKEELRELLRPIMLRRRAKDVLPDLPPITLSDVVVERSRVDFTLLSSFVEYGQSPIGLTALKKQLLEQEAYLKDTIKRAGPQNPNLLAALEATATSTSTLRRYIGVSKVAALSEMIDYEFKEKHYKKLVVFALHRDVIHGLAEKLRHHGPVTLYGGTPEKKRIKHQERFKNDPKCKLFIANIHAAGTAITLTAANELIFAEQAWVPGDNAQALKRVHRISQTRPVRVRFVGLADSVDEAVAHVVRRKTAEITEVLDG